MKVWLSFHEMLYLPCPTLRIIATYTAYSAKPGPEVIKLFSCSTQLSMKFSLLIYVKMPTTVGILTCIGGENNILGLTEPKKADFLKYFYTY